MCDVCMLNFIIHYKIFNFNGQDLLTEIIFTVEDRTFLTGTGTVNTSV